MSRFPRRSAGNLEVTKQKRKTMALHVRYTSWCISLSFFAKQKREIMPKFEALWRMWTIRQWIFFLSLRGRRLHDFSPGLVRKLKKHKLNIVFGLVLATHSACHCLDARWNITTFPSLSVSTAVTWPSFCFCSPGLFPGHCSSSSSKRDGSPSLQYGSHPKIPHRQVWYR